MLGNATTMRAEEIELSVPDGRSVRALVNVTPIGGEEGEVVSVVVTLQDLAPLEALERQRAEFLGLVSHELRTPLAAIKGSAAAVLGAAPALAQAEVHQFFRIIDAQADHMQGLIGNLLDAGRIEAGTLSVAPEPSELAALVDRARSTFLSGGARHAVAIDLPEALPPVMADRERIVQVLNNRKRCGSPTYHIHKECRSMTLSTRRVSRCRILNEATAPIGIGRTPRPLSRVRTRTPTGALSGSRRRAGAPRRRRGSCARVSGLGRA